MDSNELAQAAVGIATLCIALFTFVLASNDRRHRDDREELGQARETIARLQRERDDYERKFFAVLEENSDLRRELADRR